MVSDLERKIKKVKISPSTLSLSLEEASTALKEIENEIDYVHIDVMDGKFVLNQTDGVGMFQVAKENCVNPLDVHLMVENPLEEIKKYVGAEIIAFHIEAVKNQEEVLKVIEKKDKLEFQLNEILTVSEIEEIKEKVEKILKEI